MATLLVGFTDCSHKASRKSMGGENKVKSSGVSRKQKAAMPSQNVEGYKKEQQLRMWEYRIKYYKDRSKESKKLKQLDRMLVYDMNKERYQKLRKQETNLMQRVIRNLNSDFK